MTGAFINRVVSLSGDGVRRFAALVVVLLMLVAMPAMGQPIVIRHATTQAGTVNQQTSASGDSFSFMRVTLALCAVVSLIFFFKWGARRFMVGGVASGHSRAVHVVSRTLISPRQQLMLVKVGRRLVLVANTGAGMNTICEISDEKEVAELLGQVSSEQGDSVTKAFGSLFRREEEKFSSESPVEKEEDGQESNESPVDPEIGSTRSELSGLMEKVRLVSKQFKKS